MMSVSLPFKNNAIIENVPINSPLSANGAGVRFIPTKGMIAILHFDSLVSNFYYHIGYYNGNLETFTNNILGTKTDNRATMRCLDTGEVMLSNGNGSELYLSNKNTVLLKNGDGFFLTIDEDEFQGLFNDLNFTLNDVLIDVGRIKRIQRDFGTPVEDIIDTNPKIIRRDDETKLPLNEYNIGLGTYFNSLGIPDILKNETYDFNITPTGRLVLADEVYDEIGMKITSLKTLTEAKDILQFLLKMGTGIKIGIDSEGSLFIVNEYTDSHIKFKVGATKENDNIIDSTELEIMIAKCVFTINKDGELTFTNINPGTESGDDKKKISITTTKDSSITIKTETDTDKYNNIIIDENGLEIKTTQDNSKFNTITLNDSGITIVDKNENEINLTNSNVEIKSKKDLLLSSNAGGGEKFSLLGETTQTGLNSLLTLLSTHVHTGPAGPPAQAAQFVAMGATGDLSANTILSKFTKNN
jgi:hypothetical protein